MFFLLTLSNAMLLNAMLQKSDLFIIRHIIFVTLFVSAWVTASTGFFHVVSFMKALGCLKLNLVLSLDQLRLAQGDECWW